MFDVIAVTNRRLCETDFLKQIEEIAAAGVSSVILREKDLAPEAYEALAKEVLRICGQYSVPCALHHFTDVAQNLGVKRLHLSLPDLEANPKAAVKFPVVGVSVHSVEQAKRAQELGADYVSAGHIFETDCKKGLAPRGIPFLRNVCRALSIPVYAIGGIGAGQIRMVRDAGARGACLMSAFMKGDAVQYLENIKKGLR